MVSVLEGEHHKDIVSFLESEGFVKANEMPCPDYEVVGGYLAQIRAPEKNTQGGTAYVFTPDFSYLNYSSKMESKGIVYLSGRVKWRKTVHFVGDEAVLPEQLNELVAKYKKVFGPWDCVRDLEYALTHWFSERDS